MKYFLIIILIVGFSTTTFSQSWNNLLVSNSLEGWTVPDNNIWYKNEKGVLHIQSSPDRKGSILWTNKNYKNFVFETRFKMGEGTVDSGVFLRSESDQVQIGISGSLKRDMTGSPYIPGMGYPVEAKGVAAILKPKDWNKMKIEIKAKTYSVWLNNKMVMTYTSDKIPDSGPIGIQLHPGKDMQIDYKKMRVKEI